MSTGTEIITDALMEIGAVSIVSPAAPESIEAGRKKLNSMLELWLSKNIVLGTRPLDVAGDELAEPADTRNAIVTNLAIELAPLFANGKQIVDPALVSNARRNYQSVRSLYGRVIVPDKVLSSTTPLGAGNYQDDGYYGRTFWTRRNRLRN